MIERTLAMKILRVREVEEREPARREGSIKEAERDGEKRKSEKLRSSQSSFSVYQLFSLRILELANLFDSSLIHHNAQSITRYTNFQT